MVEQAIAPDYALSSHVAALGMTFSMNSSLPEEFRSGAFVGEHGSWNRNFFNGYKVVYIPVRERRAGRHGAGRGDRLPRRRPGARTARRRRHRRNGALLIADDAGNTVWRVAAADGSVIPRPIGTDQPASDASAAAPDGATDAAATQGGPSAAPAPAEAAAPLPSVVPDAAGGSTGEAAPPQTEIAPAVLPSDPPAAAQP